MNEIVINKIAGRTKNFQAVKCGDFFILEDSLYQKIEDNVLVGLGTTNVIFNAIKFDSGLSRLVLYGIDGLTPVEEVTVQLTADIVSKVGG